MVEEDHARMSMVEDDIDITSLPHPEPKDPAPAIPAQPDAPAAEPPPPQEKRKRGRPRKPMPATRPAPKPAHPPIKLPPAPAAATGHEYGQELILDICDADPSNFTRPSIRLFMQMLCDDVIDMEREDLHFWDYEGDPEFKAKQPPHLKGVSAVQFIRTSNITIHTLDQLRKVFVNIFSCKDFAAQAAAVFTANYFKGTIAKSTVTERL